MDGTTQGADAPGRGGAREAEKRPSRRRTLMLVLGVAGLVLALGITFSVLQATVRAHDARTVPIGGEAGIDVSIPAGEIRIAADGAPGGIEVRSSYFLRSPSVATGADAGVRKVDVDCGWPSSCDVDVTGSVPEGTDVTARVERGDVAVTGAPGVLDVRSESGDVRSEGATRDIRIASADGDVTVIGAKGAVRAEAVAGDMELTGVSGAIRARSGEGVIVGEALTSQVVEVEGGAGGVRLRFRAAPERVEVDVGEGPAEIAVPPGRYRIDADVNQGDLAVDGITEDQTATRRIVVTTRQGDATIEATS